MTFFLTFLLIIPMSTHSKDNHKRYLACTHVQLCNVIEEILTQLGTSSEISVTMPFQVQGDPHHFEPGPKVVKELLGTTYLIAPSSSLSPWLGKIIQQRSKNEKLKSFELPLWAPKDLTPKFNSEVLAHFWLHPEALCEAKKHTATRLLEWGFIKEPLKVQCSSSGLRILGQKLKTLSQKIPLVLYHDALMPYLTELGVEVTALKGSGHGEQVSTSQLKKFHQYLAKKPTVLWVRESTIHIHSQLKSLQRSADLNLVVDTLGKRHQPSSQTLSELLKKLLNVLYQHQEESR